MHASQIPETPEPNPNRPTDRWMQTIDLSPLPTSKCNAHSFPLPMSCSLPPWKNIIAVASAELTERLSISMLCVCVPV